MVKPPAQINGDELLLNVDAIAFIIVREEFQNKTKMKL